MLVVVVVAAVAAAVAVLAVAVAALAVASAAGAVSCYRCCLVMMMVIVVVLTNALEPRGFQSLSMGATATGNAQCLRSPLRSGVKLLPFPTPRFLGASPTAESNRVSVPRSVSRGSGDTQSGSKQLSALRGVLQDFCKGSGAQDGITGLSHCDCEGV